MLGFQRGDDVALSPDQGPRGLGFLDLCRPPDQVLDLRVQDFQLAPERLLQRLGRGIAGGLHGLVDRFLTVLLETLHVRLQQPAGLGLLADAL